MDLEFVSATDQQREIWQRSLHSLLHLPFEQIPLDQRVEFVDPSEVTGKGETDLAITTFTYDSDSSVVKVRNDAPSYSAADLGLEELAAKYGIGYTGVIHFFETAAHETGHSFYAALPHESRVAIAQMFGAKSDDIAELFPHDRAWEDRIGEAIADTFKEAFLPARLRVFPNRTNISIPYSLYGKFRNYFRHVPKTSEGNNRKYLLLPIFDSESGKVDAWRPPQWPPPDEGGFNPDGDWLDNNRVDKDEDPDPTMWNSVAHVVGYDETNATTSFFLPYPPVGTVTSMEMLPTYEYQIGPFTSRFLLHLDFIERSDFVTLLAGTTLERYEEFWDVTVFWGIDGCHVTVVKNLDSGPLQYFCELKAEGPDAAKQIELLLKELGTKGIDAKVPSSETEPTYATNSPKPTKNAKSGFHAVT